MAEQQPSQSNSMLQDITSVFKSNIPLLSMAMLTGSSKEANFYQNFAIMTLIPIGILLIEKLATFVWNWYQSRKEQNVHIEVRERDEDDCRLFGLFEALEWYIEKNVNKSDIKTMFSSRFRYIRDTYTDDYDEYGNPIEIPRFPLYSLNKDGSEFVVTWKDNVFNCVLCEKKEGEKDKEQTHRTILVYHEQIELIKKFLDAVNKKFEKETKSLIKTNKIMQFSSGRGWRGRDIIIKKNFSNIFLDEKMNKLLQDDIQNFIQNKKSFQKFGIPWKRGYLFYGQPGCGKTSTIYAIANEYKRDAYMVRLSDLDDKELLRSVDAIPSNSIVIFEDIDTHKAAAQREDTTTASVNADEEKKTSLDLSSMYSSKNTLGALLEILDGYNYLNGCIIIMTTNYPERLDSALIRPGRVDMKIGFNPCSYAQLDAIYKYFTGSDSLPKSLKTSKFKDLFTKKDISTSLIINSCVVPNLASKDAIEAEILKLVN